MATAVYDGFTVSSKRHRTSEFHIKAQRLQEHIVKWPRRRIFEYNVKLGMVE